jgi:hypothetical protein
MDEIRYEITKSKMDLLLAKIRALDEMRIPFFLDREKMMENVIKTYIKGIEDIRRFLVDYESNE